MSSAGFASTIKLIFKIVIKIFPMVEFPESKSFANKIKKLDENKFKMDLSTG